MWELKIIFNQRGNWQFLPILKGGVSLPKLYEKLFWLISYSTLKPKRHATYQKIKHPIDIVAVCQLFFLDDLVVLVSAIGLLSPSSIASAFPASSGIIISSSGNSSESSGSKV